MPVSMIIELVEDGAVYLCILRTASCTIILSPVEIRMAHGPWPIERIAEVYGL